MQMKVPSDQKAKHDKAWGGMMEATPVDIYGARTDYPKGQEEANLAKAQKDIRERFGLDYPAPNPHEKDAGEYYKKEVNK